VFENVPGLLSSNDGKDFETVMAAFNEAGYIFDPEILDSQFFGVAQRRRRIFIVCVRFDVLLQEKTDFSGRTLASCAAQILQDGWVGVLPAWFRDQSVLASEFQTAQLADSALARINTFESMLGKYGYAKSPLISKGDRERSTKERKD